MIRYRIRIVLLSLGVVLGYGSAYTRLVHGRPLFGRHTCTWGAEHASSQATPEHSGW